MEFMAYVLKFTVGINTFIHLLSRDAALLYFDATLFYAVFVGFKLEFNLHFETGVVKIFDAWRSFLGFTLVIDDFFLIFKFYLSFTLFLLRFALDAFLKNFTELQLSTFSATLHKFFVL